MTSNKSALIWLERLPSDLREKVFLHPSAGGKDFYRLAFYGDSILELHIRRNLYHRYPNEDVGSLSKRRAVLASTRALAFLAERWGLVPLLIYQEGESPSEYTLASLAEAFVGALAIAAGFSVFEFLEKAFMPCWDEILTSMADYKSLVQDLLVKRGQKADYRVLGKEGPDHSPIYTVALIIDGREFSEGIGRSIKEAEQAASEAFLEKAALSGGD
ncbi:MAG: ribonuclease III domain-containing protein [candidate division WOR-3 bacterium]